MCLFVTDEKCDVGILNRKYPVSISFQYQIIIICIMILSNSSARSLARSLSLSLSLSLGLAPSFITFIGFHQLLYFHSPSFYDVIFYYFISMVTVFCPSSFSNLF